MNKTLAKSWQTRKNKNKKKTVFEKFKKSRSQKFKFPKSVIENFQFNQVLSVIFSEIFQRNFSSCLCIFTVKRVADFYSCFMKKKSGKKKIRVIKFKEHCCVILKYQKAGIMV